MFLTRAGIKKLMTNAYKGGGLYIRNDGKGISISGMTWAVFFFHGEIPKETLGDLIALVGELPETGEAYTADKNGNQMEIYDDKSITAMDVAKLAKYELERTPVILESPPYIVGILQNPETLQVTAVNRRMLEIVDKSLIDTEKGEELPDGPVSGGGTLVEARFFPAATWWNNRMAFSIGYISVDDHTTGLIKNLEGFELWRGADEQNE